MPTSTSNHLTCPSPTLRCLKAMMVGGLLAAGQLATGLWAADEAPLQVSAQPCGLGPLISNRAAWEAALRQPVMRDALDQAEVLVKQDMPLVTDDDYLEYSRTGLRVRHNAGQRARSLRLKVLVLGECLENRGRFLPAIAAQLTSICGDKTWMDSAHDGSLDNYNGKLITIDLNVARTGLAVATAYAVLGDRLDPAVRERIRQELERRLFVPFRSTLSGESKAASWLKKTNNWNAICLSGVVGAAHSVLPDAADRARFVAAGIEFSRNYLRGFDDEGYSFEGLGYWNYGFLHYLILAQVIHQETGGKVDLLADPKVRHIAEFPGRIELTPGVFPAFADCKLGEIPHQWLMDYLRVAFGSRHSTDSRPTDGHPTDARPIAPLSRMPFFGETLYETAFFAFAVPPVQSPSSDVDVSGSNDGLGLRSHFRAAQVLVCRQAAGGASRLAAAFKIGRDAGSHSHHDLGTFVLAVGKDSLVVDPGRPTYTAQSFSSRRFDNELVNSFGHPVPLVAGQRQSGAGNATILDQSFTDAVDTMAIDLKPLYVVPGLQTLRRNFSFARAGAGCVAVRDDVTFSQAEEFGVALVTTSPWKQLAADQLLIGDGADRALVQLTAEGGALVVEARKLEPALLNGSTATRITIRFASRSARGA